MQRHPGPGGAPGYGFTAFLEADTEEAELRHLLAHEMIHTWFPRTARSVEPERPEGPEARTRWFHEGFTEYLSRLALLRQGLETAAWRADRTNEDLERLAYHPHATATLDELEDAVHEGRYTSSHHRLHYRRGALLALRWHRRLPSFDPGFDVAATLRTDVVTGLRRGGPAARAGLREGMEVVDLENAAPWLGTEIAPARIGRWNPDEPTVVVVEAEGRRRRFSFSARGPDREIPAFLPSASPEAGNVR